MQHDQASDAAMISAPPRLMNAIVHDRYGEAGDVMREERIELPAIGAGEVLVRVRAAGVDRGVWHLTAGLPYPARLAVGLRGPKNRVRGLDVAGVVESVGAGVTAVQPGDEVYGVADGSFAEFARARADQLAPKPARLTFAQAAAVPVSATTALQALRDRARVRPGQRVLVIGASGGVGTFAVQIAKAFGAEVTGVCSSAKVELVRSLGADRVIDYTREGIADSGDCYDAILDIGGNTPIAALRRVLTPAGTLVIVGGETDGRWLGGLERQLAATVLSPFVRQRLGTFLARDNSADLRALTELIESGSVTPVLDRTWPLSGAPAAVQYLKDGRAAGKLVVSVAAPAD